MLKQEDFDPNPIEQFQQWYAAAIVGSFNFPDACCLSTIGADGMPEGRMVLLKQCGPRGFGFFTNSNSRKGHALAAHPTAALTFFWDHVERQVRIQGTVTMLDAEASDAYFAMRPRESQIGAWASDQSAPLRNREELDQRAKEFADQFSDGEVPRPAHWNGYLLSPTRVEFWQSNPARLHDRFEYVLTAENAWSITRLNP